MFNVAYDGGALLIRLPWRHGAEPLPSSNDMHFTLSSRMKIYAIDRQKLNFLALFGVFPPDLPLPLYSKWTFWLSRLQSLTAPLQPICLFLLPFSASIFTCGKGDRFSRSNLCSFSLSFNIRWSTKQPKYLMSSGQSQFWPFFASNCSSLYVYVWQNKIFPVLERNFIIESG